jgi:hypothetical protein
VAYWHASQGRARKGSNLFPVMMAFVGSRPHGREEAVGDFESSGAVLLLGRPPDKRCPGLSCSEAASMKVRDGQGADACPRLRPSPPGRQGALYLVGKAL